MREGRNTEKRKKNERTACELLQRKNFNVICVNWKSGAGPPYTQAIANTRLIGAIVAEFITFLQENGYSPPPKYKHIIGHSLGAHVAGYIAELLDRLSRNTGLDPALLYFESTHPVVRLDPSDAIPVDVNHTDVGSFLHGGFGTSLPCGYVDFYPNGGKHQTDCADNVIESLSRQNGNVYGGMHDYVGCNYLRAHYYFIEWINPPCPFLAVSVRLTKISPVANVSTVDVKEIEALRWVITPLCGIIRSYHVANRLK